MFLHELCEDGKLQREHGQTAVTKKTNALSLFIHFCSALDGALVQQLSIWDWELKLKTDSVKYSHSLLLFSVVWGKTMTLKKKKDLLKIP